LHWWGDKDLLHGIFPVGTFDPLLGQAILIFHKLWPTYFPHDYFDVNILYDINLNQILF
jgi:hypothetical protein